LQGYGYTTGGNYYGQYAIGTTYNSAANTGTLEFFTGSGSSAPTNRLTIDSSGNTVFNETGVDADFRVESNNNANAFLVDASADQVRTDAVFVHDADGSNQPFYITRSGGLDQALKVTMDDNNVMLTSVQDETSGANFLFYSTNATTSNLPLLQLDYSSGSVFNESGVNYQNFRIESDTDAHAFYLNAANGYIGMGAGASPTQPLSVGARAGANLNYINGTTNSVSTASGILISDTITSESDVGFGLLLANNANNDNARSPLIGFSALSASNGYNHLYAAINARKISNGADTNWNTGQLEFSTGSATGPNIRMKLDRYGGLITTPTTAGHTVFNEDSADADFRVESDSNANMLFVDGGTNGVGIGKIPHADYALDVDGQILQNGLTVGGIVYNYSTSVVRPLNDPERWYKIYSYAGASSRIVKLRLHHGGDNTHFEGEFTVTLAGYGFKHSINCENYQYYNGPQILEIATKIVNSTTTEIWVKTDPITAYSGTFAVYANDPNIITPAAASEPTGLNTRLGGTHFPGSDRPSMAVSNHLHIANASHLKVFRSDDARSGSLFHNNSGTVLRTNNAGDNLYLQAGNIGNVNIQPTVDGYATIINEDGNDVDFRVESDTESNAFTVDGETGQVGVGSRSGFRFGNGSLQGNAGSSGGGYPVIGYNIRFQGTGGQYGTLVADTSWRMDIGENNRLTVHSRSATAAVTGAATYTSGPYVALNGTSWTSGSDARLKENVNTITGAIDKVKAMRPVNYTWIHDGEGASNQVGFIAQEMALVVPEVVDIPEDDEVHLGIQYEKLVPVLTAALQEAITKIESLESRIAALES
jgi:hypothetical protein